MNCKCYEELLKMNLNIHFVSGLVNNHSNNMFDSWVKDKMQQPRISNISNWNYQLLS